MIIRHNMPVMNLNHQLGITGRNQSKVLEKLASGFRINRAADDAAGLSISEKMRAQLRGLEQAQKNVQDGVSLIQVAEGALNEVHSSLQRAKELMTQAANGIYLNEDRQQVQAEIGAILGQINHIADSTNFNNIKLLDGSFSSAGVSQEDKQKFMNWLNGSWLNDAAQKIEATTGWKLKADTELSVSFESIGGKAVASMSGWYLGSDLKLKVNTDFMTSELVYEGKDGPTLGGIPSDRLITHEMVHGYMFNNVSSTAKPTGWFTEGLAEAVHGATDYRYSSYESGGSTDFDALNSAIQTFDFSNSDGKSENYTVGLIATSYLYNQVEGKAAGSFKTMLAEMNQSDETFEQLVAKYTGAASYSTFITTMKQDAQNAFVANDFSSGFLQAKCNINLTDGLADALDGIDETSSDVIPNSGTEVAPTDGTTTMMVGSTNISVNWNTSAQSGGITLQVGDTADQTLEISIKSVKTSSLGIDGISAATQESAKMSMQSCLDAINTVSEIRSSLGAYQNRLEYTMANLSTSLENTQSSESRIRDTDMARQMMSFMKNNVLTQASQILSPQINQMPNRVLELLR